jgi:transposase
MSVKVREQIKSLLGAKGVTMKEVAQILAEKTKKNYSLANLSSKLKRGTLTYNEVLIIIDYLGYKIEFTEK